MKYPCPTCQKLRTIRINRKQKPYLRCDDCGILMFVNKKTGEKAIRDYIDSNKPQNQERTLDSIFA